jgi:hypothetical protein
MPRSPRQRERLGRGGTTDGLEPMVGVYPRDQWTWTAVTQRISGRVGDYGGATLISYAEARIALIETQQFLGAVGPLLLGDNVDVDSTPGTRHGADSRHVS